MSWLAFAGVAVVVIVAPGPDMALVRRNAVVGGRRSAIHTSLGVATGLVVWSAAAAVGVTALLAASEPAFAALRLAGAAYLVWLGVRALRDAYKALRERDGVALSRGSRLSPRRAYQQPQHEEAADERDTPAPDPGRGVRGGGSRWPRTPRRSRWPRSRCSAAQSSSHPTRGTSTRQP